MQENEKRKNMIEALLRNRINTLRYVWSAFEKVITGKLDETDMMQVILT